MLLLANNYFEALHRSSKEFQYYAQKVSISHIIKLIWSIQLMEMVHVSCEKYTRAKIHELVLYSTLGISGHTTKAYNIQTLKNKY